MIIMTENFRKWGIMLLLHMCSRLISWLDFQIGPSQQRGNFKLYSYWMILLARHAATFDSNKSDIFVWFPLLIFANWVWVWGICALIWIAQHGSQYLWHYLSLHWLLDYFEVILKSLLHICNPNVKCSMANQEILWTGGSKEILWGRRQAINLTSKIWYFKWFREEKN